MKPYIIRLLTLSAMLVITLSGCAKKDDDTAKAADQAAKLAQQTTQNNSGVTAANAASKTPGIVVPAKTLAGFLPSVAGYTPKGEPETMEMDFQGMKYSHASQNFVNGEKHITVSLIDFNNISALTATYLSMINMDIETNNSSHHPINISGNPGWTNWDKNANSGMIGVYVGNRIFATLEGSGGASIDELKSAASGINYSGIASAIK